MFLCHCGADFSKIETTLQHSFELSLCVLCSMEYVRRDIKISGIMEMTFSAGYFYKSKRTVYTDLVFDMIIVSC